MLILLLGAIGYMVSGFMGIAIGVVIGVVAEVVWKVVK
jgi:tetrahydromethanopterin S-methyltransferase subunit F